MKRTNRKPPNTKPIVFYRPGWMLAPQSRCQPHAVAYRELFRQHIWQLPSAPPADIKAQLQATIAEMKGE